MGFMLGLAVGAAVGALAGSGQLGRVREEVKSLLGSVSPEAEDAAERVEGGLRDRLKHAQEVFEATRAATRAKLQRELESARSSKG